MCLLFLLGSFYSTGTDGAFRIPLSTSLNQTDFTICSYVFNASPSALTPSPNHSPNSPSCMCLSPSLSFSVSLVGPIGISLSPHLQPSIRPSGILVMVSMQINIGHFDMKQQPEITSLRELEQVRHHTHIDKQHARKHTHA